MRDTKGYQVVRGKREVMIDDLNEAELREELAIMIDIMEEMDLLHDRHTALLRKFREGDRDSTILNHEPDLRWGDRSNDPGLSVDFAWLIDINDPEADAFATVYRAPEHPEKGFHWVAHRQRQGRRDAEGYETTLELGKWCVENALALDCRPNHDKKETV